jgi:hypothetical protein
MPRPHIEPYDSRHAPFRRMTLPGFARGMWYRMLSVDPDTGACSLHVRLEGGCRMPPGFSLSEFELFLMHGELSMGGQALRPGHYLWVPAGVGLQGLTTRRGCEFLLLYNFGEPSFRESGADHPGAPRDALVSLNAYEDLTWRSGTRMPAVASGCFVKILRLDPVTKGYTFLYCMTPNFRQDNISYHDCAEESFHIWGTSHMMQFGDLPTGGYFWRPPYINHGAFSSRLGCLALGRTDSDLFNYFHFNPWTNIAENRARALRVLANEKPQLYEWVRSQDGHNHPAGAGHCHAADGDPSPEHVAAHVHGHPHEHRPTTARRAGRTVRRRGRP